MLSRELLASVALVLACLTLSISADEEEGGEPSWTISLCVYDGPGCVESNLDGECLEGEEDDDAEFFECSVGKEPVDCVVGPGMLTKRLNRVFNSLHVNSS